MAEMEIVNARISSTQLGCEDHGIMSFFVMLEWNGGGQGLGGYAIDKYDQRTKERIGCGFGITAIRKILETVGVGKWEDLKGKLIRAKINSWKFPDRAPIIGHIIEDKWFDLKEFMEKESEKFKAV